MKIMLFLLFLEFIYVQSYSYSIYSQELKKDGSVRIYSPGYCVRLDLNNFKDEKSLYFKITIHNGYWKDGYIYYDTDDYYYSTSISLYQPKYYYSESYGSRTTYYGSYYYDYDTYYYIIDKPSTNKRYLYIGIPSFYYYTTLSYYIDIENVSGFGLSVAIIVVIVIAAVAIVAASIIVYFCRRARRASYIAPPVAEYQPPVAAATAYPPPTYY